MKIWSVSDASVSFNIRVGAVGSRLMEDHDVLSLEMGPGDPVLASRVDLVIFERPLNPYHIHMFQAMGTRVGVDIDDDFSAIPPGHPGYKSIGAGNQPVLAAHRECLQIADFLTVSTPELAERFKDLNPKITVVPNSWNDTLDTWKKVRERGPRRNDNFTIGWGGTITHRSDFLIAVEALKKFAMANDVRVNIAGDPEIYKMLRQIPEMKRYFYFFMPPSAWPLWLGDLDLFLVPLKNDHFNAAKSDIKLLDSGASYTPFIASPTKSYCDWGGGGAFAETEKEWYELMNEFYLNETFWLEKTQEGNCLAQDRSLSVVMPQWLEALEIQ